jgi:hypothetical protein
LRNARAFPLLAEALASVPFGFVLVRVRVLFIAETDAETTQFRFQNYFMSNFHFRGGVEVLCFLLSTNYRLYDFDLRATHARTLLPEALASVSFGFVLVRVRVPRTLVLPVPATSLLDRKP